MLGSRVAFQKRLRQVINHRFTHLAQIMRCPRGTFAVGFEGGVFAEVFGAVEQVGDVFQRIGQRDARADFEEG